MKININNLITEGEDKLDLDSGYFTRTAFTVGSDACELYEEQSPEIVKSTKQELDGRNWYLTTMTLPAGTLFPDGTSEEWAWLVAPVVEIEDALKDQYPISDSPGDYYQTRVAVEDSKQFREFKEALVYLGML
jgi:hypothetical protein|tara:strand:- start:1614 stop:2012 length:399 start_codon:yes stop_codon:yes gene_type:complete